MDELELLVERRDTLEADLQEVSKPEVRSAIFEELFDIDARLATYETIGDARLCQRFGVSL